MIRTQLSFNQDEYLLAKAQAKALEISVAEFVRRAVRQALTIDETAPWMKFAGFVESGDATSSQNIDDVVYGHCLSRPL